jgi:hypothetical protein
MTTWHLYPALIRFGLSFCDDMAAFEALTAEQSETMAACWREAPKVAREIWGMAGEARERLEMRR